MLKKLTIAAACAALTMTAGGAVAQDKPQEKPKEHTIVIKDDATPKAKAAAKKTKDAAKKAADAVKDTKVEIKDDTTPQVKKGVRIVADAEITAAVKTKLLGDGLVGGRKIDVGTEKGVVTLTGAVNSAAEKAEALRLARTTMGVHSVVDKLTIQ